MRPLPTKRRQRCGRLAQALKPEFHLRADRFYNAPDTELDFNEQAA